MNGGSQESVRLTPMTALLHVEISTIPLYISHGSCRIHEIFNPNPLRVKKKKNRSSSKVVILINRSITFGNTHQSPLQQGKSWSVLGIGAIEGQCHRGAMYRILVVGHDTCALVSHPWLRKPIVGRRRSESGWHNLVRKRMAIDFGCPNTD